MNIQEAKEQIKKTVQIYLMKMRMAVIGFRSNVSVRYFFSVRRESEKQLLWNRSHRRWISHWYLIR